MNGRLRAVGDLYMKHHQEIIVKSGKREEERTDAWEMDWIAEGRDVWWLLLAACGSICCLTDPCRQEQRDPQFHPTHGALSEIDG